MYRSWKQNLPNRESPVVKEKEVKEEQKPQMDPADFSKTMKLPELKIPKSMKNMEMSSAPKVPDLPKQVFHRGQVENLIWRTAFLLRQLHRESKFRMKSQKK